MKHNRKHNTSIARRFTITTGMVCSLLLAVALVLGAYGGFKDPNSSSIIYAFATMAFPYLLALNLACGVLWLVTRHWAMAMMPLAAILISWPTTRIVSPLNLLPPSITPEQDSTAFTVLNYNVYNFGVIVTGDDSDKNTRAHNTIRYILDQDADVVLLQEASLAADFNELRVMKPFLKEIKEKYPYRSHGYHDLVIMSKYPYRNIEDSAIKEGFGSPDDPTTNYHFEARAYDVLLPGHTVRFFNLHLGSIGLSHDEKATYSRLTGRGLKQGIDKTKSGLSTMRHSLLGKLGPAIRLHAKQAAIIRQAIDQSGVNVIVAGDFNETPGSWTHRTIMGSDLTDAWQQCALGPTVTYHDSHLYFKIDHVLYRGDMQAVETRRDPDTGGASDHYPLVTRFVWKQPGKK